jgi:hypothetical protein
VAPGNVGPAEVLTPGSLWAWVPAESYKSSYALASIFWQEFIGFLPGKVESTSKKPLHLLHPALRLI